VVPTEVNDNQITTQQIHGSDFEIDEFDENDFDRAFDMFDELYKDKEEITSTLWKCEQCNAISEQDFCVLERKIVEVIREVIDARQNCLYSNANELLNTTKILTNTMHENSYSIFIILVQKLITWELEPNLIGFEEKKQILESLIRITQSVLPKYHFEIAQYYERYAMLLLEHGNTLEHEKLLGVALQHKQVIYPPNHYEICKTTK
jgi:hypothetical protein